jgi:hypothetical protein
VISAVNACLGCEGGVFIFSMKLICPAVTGTIISRISGLKIYPLPVTNKTLVTPLLNETIMLDPLMPQTAVMVWTSYAFSFGDRETLLIKLGEEIACTIPLYILTMVELFSFQFMCSLISTLDEAASLKTFSLLKVISTFPSLFVLMISPVLRGSPRRMGFADLSPGFNTSALPSRLVTFAIYEPNGFDGIGSSGFFAVATFFSNAMALVCFASSTFDAGLGTADDFLLSSIEMMFPAVIGMTFPGVLWR